MNKLVEAAQKFIKKVDEGKARSTESYNEFKEALKGLEPNEDNWVTLQVLPGSYIIAPGETTPKDYEEVIADHKRLVRELDVMINGEEGAAKQASLCDIVSQMKDYIGDKHKLEVELYDTLKLCNEYRELKESFQHERDLMHDDCEKWKKLVEEKDKSIRTINNVFPGLLRRYQDLMLRNKELYAPLKELIRLKDMKHMWGETPEYLQCKPKAWEKAKEAVGLGEVEELVYEDQLPEMTKEEYDEWYKTSKIVDGVRMGKPFNKMKTITINCKYGIDDLKSVYAYRGNSQGDNSGSNDVEQNKNNSWMSFGFDCEQTQEAVNAEVLTRKAWNENYIEELKEKGEYGKPYELNVSFNPHPMFDSELAAPLQSHSFHIIDLSKTNKNINE